MPAKTSSEDRAAILALHGVGLTSRKIVEALKKQNIPVSKSTVTSVVREKRNQDAGIFKPPRRIPPQNQPSVRTKELIGKVRKELGRSSQLSKRQIAKKYEVSVNSINRIIKFDLKGETVHTYKKMKEDSDGDDDEEDQAAAKVRRKERKERKSKSAKSEKDSKSSKKKSLKRKLPKVRRRRDSAERAAREQPADVVLLEPYRELSEAS